MKKIFLLIAILVVGGGGYFVYKNWRGIGPIIRPVPADIFDLIPPATSTSPLPPGKNSTQFPLSLPDGFAVSVLAKNLSGARVLALDRAGDLWVSRTKEGIITRLDIENGNVISQEDVYTKLNRPHGLAFDSVDPVLYIAEEDKISFVDTHLRGKALQKIVDLPKGGRHYTRTLLFGREGNLYVSIGSTCDVCVEKDQRFATVMQVNLEKKRLDPFAKGLRNAVFMSLHPQDGKIWITEMGRDNLGDNLPPDEVNILDPQNTSTPLSVKNYGWPICYGQNIHDTAFDKNTYIRNPCMQPFEIPAYINLPAHSAPLGLTFIPPNSQWPREYWYNLLIAYHGSWNRSEPTGYKVVFYNLDKDGKYAGEKATTVPQEENFITGWLTDKEQALGRPVDLLATHEGVLYISDDKAGVVYKVEYRGSEK